MKFLTNLRLAWRAFWSFVGVLQAADDHVAAKFSTDWWLELRKRTELAVARAYLRTDKGILITARTAELQKFVIKYGDDEEAGLDPDVFRRI